MKTITFYSYKGGVGRTLALCNIANRLAEFRKKVCIIDFDLEAPGIHLKYDNHIGINGVTKGLVDYIYDFTTTDRVPADIRDYITPIIFEESNLKGIELIAAGNTSKKDYWKKLSAIDWNRLFYEESSVGVDFFLNLKEQIRSQIDPDFLLIDSRTGITEISGITMSILADEVVLMAANNKENIDGIGQVIKTLANPANSIKNEVPKIDFVLSRIPYFTDPKDKPKETNAKNKSLNSLNGMLHEANIDAFKIEKAFVIHSDPELEMQEKFKISYEHERSAASNIIPIGLDYLEIFEELTGDVISPQQKQTFNNFLRAQMLMEKAMANQDYYEKISGLNAALEINPDYRAALTHLAEAYLNIKDYGKVIESVDKVLQNIRYHDPYLLHLKAAALFYLDNFEGASTILLGLLEKNNDDDLAIMALGMIRYRQGNLEEALTLQRRSIDIDPGDAAAWNTYANTLRASGRLDEAMEAIYNALEIEPQDPNATGTLAEIHAASGNMRDFYKNLELSFSFGMTSKLFQEVLETENIYRQFAHDEKFRLILAKYDIDVDLSVLEN